MYLCGGTPYSRPLEQIILEITEITMYIYIDMKMLIFLPSYAGKNGAYYFTKSCLLTIAVGLKIRIKSEMI